MRRLTLTFGLLIALGCMTGAATPVAAKSKSGRLHLRRIGSFAKPTYISGAPGFPRLLFVTEESGRVIVIRDGRKLPRPFLDIGGRVLHPLGIYSIAFPPDYRSSGRFYVDYTDSGGDVQIDEYRRDSPVHASAASRRRVLRIDFPPVPVSGLTHYGGQLAFGGRLLYISVGDGSKGGDIYGNAENPTSLMGKILRIHPRPHNGHPYGVPASNPLPGGGAGRREILAYGFRNPWRFSIQRIRHAPDRLLIADLGENRYEELDYTTIPEARGADFGWPYFEGTALYDCGLLCPGGGKPDPGGTVPPIFTYPQSSFGGVHGACGIIGGYVDRDPALPALARRYIYGDLCTGQIRSLVPHLGGGVGERPTGLVIPGGTPLYRQLDSFGTDEAGHIYAVSQTGGIYRILQRGHNE